jgi:hypothetical protein
MLVTFSLPEFNLKKQIIIMNFNDHTVTWDTDTIPMKERDKALYHQ